MGHDMADMWRRSGVPDLGQDTLTVLGLGWVARAVAGVEELAAVDRKDETEHADDIVADVVAGVENDPGRCWRRNREMRDTRHLEEAVDADGPG